jgi:hypothetical protein
MERLIKEPKEIRHIGHAIRKPHGVSTTFVKQSKIPNILGFCNY